MKNAKAALESTLLGDGGSTLQITLADGDSEGAMSVFWPVQAPAAILDTAKNDAANAEDAPGDDATEKDNARDADASEPTAEDAFSRLPAYTRSLLKIGVPVVVRLATKKQSVSEILELGPGAILKFEKRCDESLDMCVGDRKIAAGEVVKVGDKFGLRVSSIALPAERFHSAQASMRGGSEMTHDSSCAADAAGAVARMGPSPCRTRRTR